MILRSHAKWIYEGEQNSKYFCNLEKRYFIQKTMCFIQKDDGDIIHDSNLIIQEVKTFYENLYASHENNIIHCNIDNIILQPYHKRRVTVWKGLSLYKKHCHLLSKWKMTEVLVLMASQLSFFNSFSQTWVHLWCALLTMSSTVAKCRSHKDKGLLFVYPRWKW